jgi:Kef-type K+ transport system membrane component KefB
MGVIALTPLPALDEHSLLVFWCQILIVLTAARAGGYLFRRIGMPRVVGEILGGVALGPSLLGQIWPSGFDWLFPASERQAGLLLGLAWVGIVLLLGITGAEIDMTTIGGQGRAAVAASIGSLGVPLLLGALVGAVVPDLFIGTGTTRSVFLLFFAVAFAISSLPVAARILSDLGLIDRPFAQLALGVATVNDIVGWLLLGVVVGIAESGTFEAAPLVIALVTVVTIGILVVRLGPRVLDGLASAVERRDGGPAAEVSLITLVIVAVGTVTHAVGIEVVIGAFIAGIAIGGSRLRHSTGFASFESVTNGIFAPLFFAVAGIRVDLSQLAERSVAIWAIVVTVAATAAKLVGSYVGGRVGGLTGRDSMGLSASLNARGALEIVVATVGLALEVIDSTAYTVIVVMALVTTAMTGPILARIYRPPNSTATRLRRRST